MECLTNKIRFCVFLYVVIILGACTTTPLQKEQTEIFLNKGISFIELRQYPNALRELLEAEKYNSRDQRIYYYMGMVYHAMDMKEKAVDSFQQAISLKDDYAKAMDSYRRALQREPQTVLRPQIEKNIGLIYFYQSDMPNAIYHFNKSVELNPNLFDAHFFLGEC